MATTLHASNMSIFDLKARACVSISRNVRSALPFVSEIAVESCARARVRSQAEIRASFDFIPCENDSSRVSSALLFEHESRHSSRVLRDRYRVRVWRGLSYPLDAQRY